MTVYYARGDFVIRDAEYSDIEPLAKTMRKEDVNEVWASFHWTPLESIVESYRNSTMVFTIAWKDTVVAMIGVVPDSLLSKRSIVWMLSSDAINLVKVAFLRTSQEFIRFLLSMYPHLYNFVDARHRLTLKWLKWCGAQVFAAQRFGEDNLPFHYFSFNREH